MLATDATDIRAAVDHFRESPWRVARAMDDGSRRAVVTHWLNVLSPAASTLAERRVLLNGVDAKTGDGQLTLRAATSTMPLSGGLVPSEQWHGVEFGMDPKRVSVIIRKPGKIGRFQMRWIGKNFRARNARGYLVYRVRWRSREAIVRTWIRAAVAGIINRSRFMDTV